LPVLLRHCGLDGKQCDPREIALEQCKHIEVAHHPQPLSDKVLAELDHILETAESEAEKIFGDWD
jgi:hypothetical protein